VFLYVCLCSHPQKIASFTDTHALYSLDLSSGDTQLCAGGASRSLLLFDLDAVAAMVRAGSKRRDIALEHGSEFIKFHRGIGALDAALNDTPRQAPPEVYWFWGPTGTGKTRTAFAACEASGGAYFKMSTNKWWDGYERHENVIIDDFRRDFSTFAELLRLLDRYPMTVEIKGGSVQFVAKRIYITTPKNIVDTWEGRTNEDIEQLRRRVTEERYFPGIPVVPAMFAQGFIPPV